MGCNCKVNEKILKINKKYGVNTNAKISEKIIFKLKEIGLIIGIIPLYIICLPIVLTILLVKFVKGERNINVNKFLRIFYKKK